jgi:hypothetical protein
MAKFLHVGHMANFSVLFDNLKKNSQHITRGRSASFADNMFPPASTSDLPLAHVRPESERVPSFQPKESGVGGYK